MNCANCGNQLSENAKFCNACGRELEIQDNNIEEQGVTIETTTQDNTVNAEPKHYKTDNNNFEEPKPSYDSKYAVMGTGSYLGAMFIMAIPVVGWIIAIVWALGGTKKVNKRNFARATIVMTIIWIVIFSLISFLIGMLLNFVIGAISSSIDNFVNTNGTSISEFIQGDINLEELGKTVGVDVGEIEQAAGVDLSSIDLSSINLENVDLSNIDLSNIDMNNLGEVINGIVNTQP